MAGSLFTIGHSNQTIEEFLTLLLVHHIDVVADVRSVPYSQHTPQFNKEVLVKALKTKGIQYVFLGKELGARTEDLSCYEHGKVVFDRLRNTNLFKTGIERLLKGLEKGYRIAIMCSEKDPLGCHRFVLVSRSLQKTGCQVLHILSDGSLERQEQACQRLMELLKLEVRPLFDVPETVEEEAFRKQGEKIAFMSHDHEEA